MSLQNDLTIEQAAQKPLMKIGSTHAEEQSRETGFSVQMDPRKGVLRILCFFALIVLLIFAMNAIINVGLRRITTSEFGAENQMMQGKVNADIVITGSSRALRHYDPRIIQEATGMTTFNLGRNGSQTDVQVAVLKAYLEHNRKPKVVIHNLDAFSFVTTKEIFEPATYVPYLNDKVVYDSLHPLNPNLWKSRYIPLYGYVVDDMNFSWILGLKGFVGINPREDYIAGFNPQAREWTNDFENFKASHPQGVSFQIEPAGVLDVQELINLCKQNGIQLIFVYSPEYSEMQPLTNNRAEIFRRFEELANQNNVLFLDYSGWKYSGNRAYFYNSQHLNADGAAAFSADLAAQLRDYFAGQSSAGLPVSKAVNNNAKQN